MFPGLTLTYWLTLHGLVTLLSVVFYAVTSHVMQQRRHPTAAIAWVLFFLLVPYVALPIFLMFGSRKQIRPRIDPLRQPPECTGGSWAVRTALSLGQPAPAEYRDLHLHADGSQALRALLRTIDSATRTLDVCTFILAPGDLGRRITERLAEKARAGVHVRLLLDGLGRFMGGWIDLTPLREAGVDVSLFVRPLHSPLAGRSNLRNHRKMVIADSVHGHSRSGADADADASADTDADGVGAGRRLWCGGRNLAPEYFEGSGPNKAPWHDLTFDLTGPLVEQAAALFEHDWQFANGGGKAEVALLPTGDSLSRGLPFAQTGAQLVASGPDQFDDTIYSLLVTAAYRAQRRIALITPYFVPDTALLLALCLAARRGVTVDLLIPGRSNHLMSDIARRRALRTLAAAGGRIWLAPQMLHAKLAVIDDALALAGSANLDSRSLFLNYELMFAFHDVPAIRSFGEWFDRERANASQSTPRRASFIRDVGEGLVLWVGFQL